MTDLQRIAPDTIRFERWLDAEIDIVWRYLVDPELRGRWFAAGPLEPRVGGAIALTFDHDNLSAEDVPYPAKYAAMKGAVGHETVVAIDPPRLLAFSWDGGKEGTATFELFAEAGRTRLVLTHSGISGAAPMANFGGGWHAHLAVLQGVLSGDRVRNFWALHAQSEAAVVKALG